MSSTLGSIPFTSVTLREEVVQQLEARAASEHVPSARVLAACVAYLAAADADTSASERRPYKSTRLRRMQLRMTPPMLRARAGLMQRYPTWSQAVEDAIVRYCEQVILY